MCTKEVIGFPHTQYVMMERGQDNGNKQSYLESERRGDIIHEDESKDVRTMRQAELRLQEYRRQHRTLAYEVGKNWGWGQDNK